MANRSRWEDIKKERSEPSEEVRAGVEQDLDLGQLIYDLRIEVGLSQRELAERMGTTQSVISRLEEGGGTRNRIDTLARAATALGRHLVLSFPAEVPDRLQAVPRTGGAPPSARPAIRPARRASPGRPGCPRTRRVGC